ncbi:hypothetical protein [Geodermatophilus sp. SYSU D01119]
MPTPTDVTAAMQRVSASLNGKAPALTRDELLGARAILSSGTPASMSVFTPALLAHAVARIDARLHALDTGTAVVEPKFPWIENVKGGLALLAMVAVIGGIIWAIVAAATGDGEDEAPTSEGAYYACEHFVGLVLKAPSTADFTGYDAARITDDGGDRYTVRGQVDAENSFGAMLRSDYSCTVRHTDEGWVAVGVPVVD